MQNFCAASCLRKELATPVPLLLAGLLQSSHIGRGAALLAQALNSVQMPTPYLLPNHIARASTAENSNLTLLPLPPPLFILNITDASLSLQSFIRPSSVKIHHSGAGVTGIISLA